MMTVLNKYEVINSEEMKYFDLYNDKEIKEGLRRYSQFNSFP
jgi:glutaredoxin-related protein